MIDVSQIHVGSGMFWFWEPPWWQHADALLLRAPQIGGLQILTEFVHDDYPLPPVDSVVRWLAAGLQVSVHPTFHDRSALTFDARHEFAFGRFNDWLSATGVSDVVVHYNHVADRGALDAFSRRLPMACLLVENLGASAECGHTLQELRALLEIRPEVGFVLDVAHVSELSVSRVEEWLTDPLLSSRLAMIHMSCSGTVHNATRATGPATIREADHLPAFLAAKHFKIPSHLPVVTEGCLPLGNEGWLWLARELHFLTSSN